mgnify:FL=1
MFRIGKTTALAALIAFGSSALAAPTPPEGEPAAIMITAERAQVIVKNGKTTLVLTKPGSVVTVVAALNGKRTFATFPLKELPVSWNSCNLMKDQQKWWNEDGYNAMFQFDKGVAKHPDNAHFAYSRLLTAPKKLETTMEGAGGSAKLKLLNVDYRSSLLTFEVVAGKISPGSYSGVGVLAECYAIS